MEWQPLQSSDIIVSTNWTTSLSSIVDSQPVVGSVSWLSPFVRTIVLGTIMPSSVVACMLFYDVLSAVQLPKVFYSVAQFFRSPFKNFLGLEDLEEPTGELHIPPLWKARLLAILSCFEAIGWSARLAYDESAGTGVAETVEVAIGFIVWSYTFFRILTKPLITAPYLLILFYTTQAFVAVLDLYALFSEGNHDLGMTATAFLRLVVTTFLVWLAGTFPLEARLPAKNVATGSDIPSNTLAMPEDSVNLWSWCTFSFVEPIFGVANQRTVNETDVWSLSPYFTHKNLFTKYLEYCKEYPTHSLLRFLITSNSLDLILDVSLEMWSAVVGFVPPYCLQRILSALADPSSESRTTAYLFTFLMFLANLSFAQVDINQRWYTRRCYERTRGQLFCALHYKALKRRDVSGKTASGDADSMSEEKTESADLGKITNLMQGDAYSVAQRFWEFSGLFSSPVRLTIAMIFLYRILGWSSFAGVAVILVAYVLNYPFVTYDVFVTRKSWSARDRRMNLVDELFQNIRFLKFYGWETRWAQRVRDARETELRWRVQENIVSVAISFIWTWIPSATALSCFLCYTLIAAEKLTVSKAFTSVALFSQLQEPMTRLPQQITALLQAYVSMQRIEQFLREQEVPDWASSLKSSARPSLPDEGNVGFEDASFEWDTAPKSDTPSRFTLGPLNIQFPKGKMTLISGATGSGKSALLQALLGEMHCTRGRVVLNKLRHQVAYCAQNPWLEHATIRDNIIFASKFGYDEARYNTVVEACALNRDLDIFEAGDLTEIGEKGITLSGGQRARIALARALYSQATCILLDDPLAAVDMHTAQHLVKNVLAGDLARDRTIILVTHHITLCLPTASYLVELASGRVARQGSIDELRRLGQLEELVQGEDVVDAIIPSEVGEAAENVENSADLVPGDVGHPIVPKKSAANGQLVDVEARAEGRVALRTYLTYIKAAGIPAWILILFLTILLRVITIGNQFYLARWGEAYENTQESIMTSLSIPQLFWNKLPNPNSNVVPWLLIYLYISLAGAISIIIFLSVGYYSRHQASRFLFASMLRSLTGAPTRFYDITPVGRILNRFTSDINCIDYNLLNSVRAAMSGVLNFAASIGVIIWVVPTFAPFAVVIAWLYIRLAPSYVQASRDLRRLESISLSPAFAGFDELLRGLPHVRAFAMEARYQNGFYKKVDKLQSFDHVYWLVANWLMWRYDCLGSVIVFLATVFALYAGVKDGLAALVIVQAGAFAEASRQLVRVLAQLELDANSVERVIEYLDVKQEAPAVTSVKPPAYWPSNNGELVVENLVVKYAPDLPSVLHNLSFTVRPAEKIGIVGRTGSGKSTLALSLLRIVEASGGKILIDGIDISTLGLDDLRTRVTIISQDVSLFTGTIRSNLDPFGEHTDEESWEVLERCHLTSILSVANTQNKHNDTKVTLDMPISQSGSLSAGERQLVAMARALLRRSNVVIMDEATSQIDTKLDDQIQRTIRDEFRESIVITIAHRLRTVLDYDRILVLGDGEILEFDTPQALINRNGGVFREMCKASADWPLLQSLVDRSQF